MKFDSAYPSSFLRCLDLEGESRRVEIESIKMEKIGDKQKVVVGFAGLDKRLVLNKTNGTIIRAALNEAEMENWVGAEIVLNPATTNFQGRMVECIRVSVPGHRAQSSGGGLRWSEVESSVEA
jgi:hypothetical protein